MTDSGSTMLSVLNVAQDKIPEQLIDYQGYALIAAIADQLPWKFSTFWGVECRLGQAASVVDILYKIDVNELGVKMLSGETASLLDQLCDRHPVWQSLRTLGRLWQNPEHMFANALRNIWLEFDTASALSAEAADAMIGVPCFFWGPSREGLHKVDLHHLVVSLIPDILGVDIDKESSLSFLESIPPHVTLFQVGYMLARENQELRICLNDFPPHEIPIWLMQNGWQGDVDALTEIVDKLANDCKYLALNLSVGQQGVGAKIGIECYMDWLVEDVDQWSSFLDFLEEQGLSTREKRFGVEQFPGISKLPTDMRVTDEGLRFLNIYRKIHHIKVAFFSDGLVEAKAYMSFSQALIDPNMIFPAGGSLAGKHPWLTD